MVQETGFWPYDQMIFLSIFLRWGIIYIIYIFWTIVLIFVAMFITKISWANQAEKLIQYGNQ